MTNKTLNLNKNECITYDKAIQLVKDEVDNILSTSPLIIRGYTKHLTNSRGKFIRAMSVIMCAEKEDGNIHPDAIKIAAAIEILHLATLVHDDVIDNADLRRGEITLQKKYGKRTAVICGDYLLCTALRLTTSIENAGDYLKLNMPDYMGKVCLGELNQHINNTNLNLSVYQYLKIISGKTAALFEASFYAGALFLENQKTDLNRYRQLGFYIGMIFQLTDDCIDFENTRDEALKPVQSDYEQGVITLPLIHALKNLGGFKDKAKQEGVTREEINEAVKKTGGLDFTRIMVQKYHNKSMKLITQLDAHDIKKDKLILILNKAARLA